jgi:tripartite-type tricarboxylate transporter receptor subunit TctC
MAKPFVQMPRSGAKLLCIAALAAAAATAFAQNYPVKPVRVIVTKITAE